MTAMMQPRMLPGGRRAWLDGEVVDFVDALTRLDPRLALVQCEDGRWEIWRCAEDGSEVIVCRSKPGARLGPQVIEHLAQGDTRHHDVMEQIIRKNDLAEKHRQDGYTEATMIAMDAFFSKVWKGRVSQVDDGVDVT